MPNTEQDIRIAKIKNWLSTIDQSTSLNIETFRLSSADASARRYFRIEQNDGRSLLIMDAPPENENCQAFIDIDSRLSQAGVNVPSILAQNLNDGFLLISDLGSQNYYQKITQGIDDKTLQTLYRQATTALVTMQKANCEGLPLHDGSRSLAELSLFTQWYVNEHCQYQLDDEEKNQLEALFVLLTQHSNQEPRVFLHRDFQSPNLLIADQAEQGTTPGIIDFQDAKCGPISYDLASLVMDGRLQWEEPQQLDWAIRYWEQARKAELPVPDDFAVLHLNYEIMSLQRNLRILGIFARLIHQADKPEYAQYIPHVKAYVRQVAQRYSVCGHLVRLLDKLDNVQAKVGYTF